MKAFLIVLLVVALLLGLLLTLRSSRNAGIPSRDVLERATKRAREQEQQEQQEHDE